MQAVDEKVRPKFKGSKEAKELARKIFEAATGTARFFGSSSAIQVSLDAITMFVAGDDGDQDSTRKEVESALGKNAHVFLRDERDEGVFYVTTRSGIAPPKEEPQDLTHSFKQRFQDPPPVPEFIAPQRASQPMVRADAYSSEGVDGQFDDSASLVTDELAEREPEYASPPRPVADIEVLESFDDASDAEIIETLKIQLGYDYAVANFGDRWMAEDRVPRLSRGDMRRIRDYIHEMDGPVSDQQIVQDLLGIRANASEYHLHTFAVNFRLSRETREFEFVGIPGHHLWTVSGIDLPSVTRRKASDVGQDYRVLLDLNDGPESAGEGVVEHVLTFYEHLYGVLPYDATFQSIIPGPVLEGQRSALLRFESPSSFESFPVELRFPTSNRGGFLSGFADFFREHLVPGAFITIEAGEQPGHYTIEFLTVSGQDRKLLVLDEKKNQYQFVSKTFYSAPNEDMLISENRFPKLGGTTPLDDRTRRQPFSVLEHAFRLVGEKLDDEPNGPLMAVIDEIVAASNIERPMPAGLIRQIASSESYPQISLDPEADDVIYFRPEPD